jgi:hypothetical protein
MRTAKKEQKGNIHHGEGREKRHKNPACRRIATPLSRINRMIVAIDKIVEV